MTDGSLGVSTTPTPARLTIDLEALAANYAGLVALAALREVAGVEQCSGAQGLGPAFAAHCLAPQRHPWNWGFIRSEARYTRVTTADPTRELKGMQSGPHSPAD